MSPLLKASYPPPDEVLVGMPHVPPSRSHFETRRTIATAEAHNKCRAAQRRQDPIDRAVHHRRGLGGAHRPARSHQANLLARPHRFGAHGSDVGFTTQVGLRHHPAHGSGPHPDSPSSPTAAAPAAHAPTPARRTRLHHHPLDPHATRRPLRRPRGTTAPGRRAPRVLPGATNPHRLRVFRIPPRRAASRHALVRRRAEGCDLRTCLRLRWRIPAAPAHPRCCWSVPLRRSGVAAPSGALHAIDPCGAAAFLADLRSAPPSVAVSACPGCHVGWCGMSEATRVPPHPVAACAGPAPARQGSATGEFSRLSS
jgi:hypothetical protein